MPVEKQDPCPLAVQVALKFSWSVLGCESGRYESICVMLILPCNSQLGHCMISVHYRTMAQARQLVTLGRALDYESIAVDHGDNRPRLN
jgi:hypothetical protein